MAIRPRGPTRSGSAVLALARRRGERRSASGKDPGSRASLTVSGASGKELNVRTPIALLSLAIAAAALAAGCGSSGSGADAGAEAPPYGAAQPATTSASPSGAPATVATATGDLGTLLVGPGGRTLYTFEKDAGSTSACTGACADAWPPLTTSGAPEAGGAARAALLGTTARPDGGVQVTYAGHPLYLYAGDAAAGETNGQGFGDAWYVVAPTGKAIEGEES